MAAPKGNKNAEGNEGGRPAHFENPEELQTAVDAYFVYIKGEYHIEKRNIEDEEGNISEVDFKVCDRHPEPCTITGLALHLGFSSRSSFKDYENRSIEFSYIIKRAKLRVENAYELQLQNDKPTGAIFALKNMGWADRQEIDHTTQGDKLNSIQVQIIPPKDED